MQSEINVSHFIADCQYRLSFDRLNSKKIAPELGKTIQNRYYSLKTVGFFHSKRFIPAQNPNLDVLQPFLKKREDNSAMTRRDDSFVNDQDRLSV